MINSQNTTLHSNQKEETTTTSNNMGKSHRCNIEQKHPGTKKANIIWFYLYEKEKQEKRINAKRKEKSGYIQGYCNWREENKSFLGHYYYCFTLYGSWLHWHSFNEHSSICALIYNIKVLYASVKYFKWILLFKKIVLRSISIPRSPGLF